MSDLKSELPSGAMAADTDGWLMKCGIRRKGHIASDSALGSVGRALRLLHHCAEYFQKTGIPLRRLAALSAIARLTRFLAFLLPFKVLMFMVAGRGFHVAGITVAPAEVAGALLALAMLLFLIQLWLSRVYDKRIGAVFGEEAREEAVEELMHHGQEVRSALNSAINLRAAAFLGMVLLAANLVLFPPTILMLVPIASYVAFVVYSMALSSYEKSIVPGNYNAVTGFLSMVAVLLLLGAFVLRGAEVHFILALFVFISFRYITNCLVEICSILYRYRSGVMPAFLRARIDDHEKADLRVASGPPPFLATATKNGWFQEVLHDIVPSRAEPVDAVWNHSSSTQSFGFILSSPSDSPVLINVFQPSGKSAFLQERAIYADFAGCPFLLQEIGHARKGQFSILAYDLEGTEPIKHDEIHTARQTLTSELLKACPPEMSRMKIGSGDMLKWLTPEGLDTLRAVSPDRESTNLVDWLEANLPAQRQRVAALPLALNVPSIQSSQLCRHVDGSIKLMSWNGADLEPIGSGLGLAESRRNLSIDDLLSEVKAHRTDCARVTADDIEISASMFALARYVKRRDWGRVYSAIEALRCIPSCERH